MTYFVNGMATILVVIFALQLVVSFKLNPLKHTPIFLLLSGLVSFFLSPFYIGTFWLWLGVPFVVSVPFSFYVFSRNQFSDRSGIPLSIYIGFAFFVLYCTYVFIVYPEPKFGLLSHFYISRLILIGFFALGFFEIVRDFQADMINYRRVLRLVLVVTLGLVITAHFIVDIFVTNGRSITVGIALVFVFVLTLVCTYLLSPSVNKLESLFTLFDVQAKKAYSATSGEALHSEKQENESISDSSVGPNVVATLGEIQLLEDMMLKEHLYREHGLTLAHLSKKMKMREYLLRKLINSQLGYNNFNEYLSDYRLQEVVDRFHDREYDFTPIHTLAYDAGYKSISPFNRAFKKKYNLSPSAYRKKIKSLD